MNQVLQPAQPAPVDFTGLGFDFNDAMAVYVAEDYPEAKRMFEILARQDFEPALHCLGLMYFNGEGVTKDYEQAYAYFVRAAELGYASSQNIIAIMIQKRYVIPSTGKTAVDWLRSAAEKNYAPAQFNLGRMYANGDTHLNQDKNEARKWYLRAAEQECSDAQYNLAQMYALGDGVPIDYKVAYKWFSRAAEHGDELAQLNLGVMYLNGYGVLQDYVMAYKWLNIAASNGASEAITPRSKLVHELSSSQIEEGQYLAREWVKNRLGSSSHERWANYCSWN